MGQVYVVHCIDTEGPLNESITASFKRIEEIGGKKFEPSEDILEKIQSKQLDFDGREDMMAEVFSKRLLSYNRNWGDLDGMLDRITSKEYRDRFVDSEGRGWRFTWFIMDHIGYDINPRDRIIGYNAIWDHYREYYDLHHIEDDEFQHHIHPSSTYREANRCGSSYWNSDHALKSFAHRLIDRGFFPNCYRPGFHTERPDSHWLLEQFIPYDYANQAVEMTENEKAVLDLTGGRFGDWRRAPSDWRWYHPSHDDYQTEGACRRVIFRCLNVGTRLRLINQEETDKAFARAAAGEDTVMAFCDHDFREMSYDIEEVYGLIRNAHERYPDVEWVNSTASAAAIAVLGVKPKPIGLEMTCKKQPDGRIRVEISTDMDTFGPQPFFAIKTKGGDYRVENLDVQEPFRKWSFVFDGDSIHPEDVSRIGVATNSRQASGSLIVCTVDNEVLFESKW